MVTPNIRKDVEQLELLFIALSVLNSVTALENKLAFSYEAKDILFKQLSNCPLCYSNFYSSFIYNSPKLKTSQVSTNKRTVQQNVV